MSTYQIKTSTITFEVTAEDSDMACLAANQEIQRRGMPIESQRAELVLLDGDNSLSLGTFSLTGVELPTTWAALSELRKDLLAAAKADAASNWDLRVIRSRGAVLVAEDAEGKTLLATGDSWDMPKTLKGFKAALANIKSQFPTASKVFICIGCDAANSVASMNNGQYTPWAGEAQALVHIYQESNQQHEQPTMSVHTNTPEDADAVTWTGEQYLSSAPVDVESVAESGSIMQWAIDECNFADSNIEGGAQALAAVAYKQLLEQDSGENEVLAALLRQYEGTTTTSAYTLTESCPEKAIVQHTEAGNYDYSEHSSLETAWEAEKGESWVSDWVSNADYEDEIAINEARQSFMATLCEYSKDEILAAADEGYGWPEELGFVKAKE